jgi:hypothetical protein
MIFDMERNSPLNTQNTLKKNPLYSTIADGGKVGVWTKADSVTLFDDFRYGKK